MECLYRFNADGSLAYGPDMRGKITDFLIVETAKQYPATLPFKAEQSLGEYVVPEIVDGVVTEVNSRPYDLTVSLAASADGITWDSDAGVDLGSPMYFKIEVESGAQSVSILDGKTKRIPVFLAGATSVIYKKADFSVTGDVATAVLSWIPDQNTDYLIRPLDIMRSYPNVIAEFITGDARCEVAD